MKRSKKIIVYHCIKCDKPYTDKLGGDLKTGICYACEPKRTVGDNNEEEQDFKEGMEIQ